MINPAWSGYVHNRHRGFPRHTDARPNLPTLAKIAGGVLPGPRLADTDDLGLRRSADWGHAAPAFFAINVFRGNPAGLGGGKFRDATEIHGDLPIGCWSNRKRRLFRLDPPALGGGTVHGLHHGDALRGLPYTDQGQGGRAQGVKK